MSKSLLRTVRNYFPETVVRNMSDITGVKTNI